MIEKNYKFNNEQTKRYSYNVNRFGWKSTNCENGNDCVLAQIEVQKVYK